MSDRPVEGWVQGGDGKWYHPATPVKPPPPANEATALLRQIAKDMGTVKSIAVFWTFIYIIGIVLFIVAWANASDSLS